VILCIVLGFACPPCRINRTVSRPNPVPALICRSEYRVSCRRVSAPAFTRPFPYSLHLHSTSWSTGPCSQHGWKPSDQPEWLTEKFYITKIQPVLASMSASAIARTISVSRWYAGRIREGYRPHQRHWKALATLAGFPEGPA